MSAAALLRRLWRDRRAVSAVEFALILPVLVMFSAGTIEYSRLILVTQKLQSGAFLLADLTARDETVKTADMANIFLAIGEVVKPFDFAGAGRAIVSSVGAAEDDKPTLNWQCPGSGTLAATSLVGTVVGKAVALPAGLAIRKGETIIAAEVYYAFKPLFGIGLAPRTIRRVAFFKPRLGDLASLVCPT